LHPMQTQAVTYITQRAASLAAFFYLASVVCYLRARVVVRREWLWFGLSLASGLLGMLTKENVFTLPMAILMTEFLLISDAKRLFQRRNATFFALLATGFLAILLIVPSFFRFDLSKVFYKGVVSGSHESDYLSPAVYLLTQFRVIIKYLQLLVLPIGQSLDYDFPASYSLWERETLLCFLVLALILILAGRLITRERLFSYGIFLFFLTISVESSIIPIHHVIYDHRVYLPSVGFFLAITSLLGSTSRDRIRQGALLLVLAAAFSIMTFQRNKVWTNEFTLWEDVIRKAPLKARGYYNLGNLYFQQGQMGLAMAYYDRTLDLNSNYYGAHNNRGNILRMMNRWEEALDEYDQAIRINPQQAELYNNRGFLYVLMGNNDMAFKDFDQAIVLNPDYADAYSNRGILFAQKGDFRKALNDFDQALEHDPHNSNALRNRAIMMEKMK